MACTIQCAAPVLSQLPKEALNALIGLANTANTALSALKINKQLLSLNMDIQLGPLLAKQAIVKAAIGDLQSATQVVPSNFILQCPPLGAINTSLQTALLGPIENALNINFDIGRLTGIKIGISSEIAQIDAAQTFFQGIIDCANEALSTATA